jgi:hypothetical protein
MPHLVKIHVIVLLAAVIFGSLANGNVMVHAFGLAPEPARSAGCHEHQQPVPKSPVSYACCQMGHGSMLVRAAETGPQDLSVGDLRPIIVDGPVKSAELHPATPMVGNTGEPPGLIPLRI